MASQQNTALLRFLVCLTIAAGVSCGEFAPVAAAATVKELDRGTAAALINRDTRFGATTKIYNVNGQGFSRAVADHLWEKSDGWWRPTEKGSQYFIDVSLVMVTLRNPLHREVTQVTGITGGERPGEKIAEFTWHFTDLLEPLARYTGTRTDGHQGIATLRRYDDGWRVTDVKTGDGQDGANARPFKADENFSATKTAKDICAMALAWEARYTDLNTYHLVPATWPPSTDARYRIAGAKTTAEVESAFSPTYLKTFPERDAFGREYRFEVSADGNHFTITSLGADGKVGTADDLVIHDGRWLRRPPEEATACNK